MVCIRVTTEERRRLKAAAEREGVSVSVYLRKIALPTLPTSKFKATV